MDKLPEERTLISGTGKHVKTLAMTFRLRTLMLAVVVAAIVSTPIAYRAKTSAEQRAAVHDILELGGRVIYDHEWEPDAVSKRSSAEEPQVRTPNSRFLCRAISEDFFHSVSIVDFGGCDVDNLDLTILARLRPRAVREVHLNDTRGRDLRPLSIFTNLEYLDIQGTPVNSLEPCRSLHRLRSLVATDTQVSDLSPTMEMPLLELAEFSGTPVSDLSPFAESFELRELWVNETDVCCLNPLARLSQLEELHSAYTRVNDLSALRDMSNLHWLELNDTRVTDLVPLSRLTNLTTLILSDTEVRDIRALAALKTLKLLDIQNTYVGDLSPITGNTSIEHLAVSGCPISDISAVASLSQLQHLNVANTDVRDLRPLAELCDLRYLDISRTLVSEADAQEFTVSHPLCEVVRGRTGLDLSNSAGAGEEACSGGDAESGSPGRGEDESR